MWASDFHDGHHPLVRFSSEALKNLHFRAELALCAYPRCHSGRAKYIAEAICTFCLKSLLFAEA
jgi:hypothetical protein